MKIIELKFKDEIFPISISYILSDDGIVSYKAEYVGSTISTFRHFEKYIANSEKEVLELIGKSLIQALEELRNI